MRLTAAIVGLVIASPAVAEVSLVTAYWAPDRGTPYEWFEGAKEIQAYFSDDYRAAGYLYAYVRNDGDTPVSPSAFSLDGRPLEELREEFSVIWWRVLPDPVPAGGLAEVMVRLRAPLTKPTTLKVEFGAEAFETQIAPEPPPVRIETIGFAPDASEVFLVAEALDQQPHRLSKVLLDGRDVSKRARMLAPQFATGISPVRLSLAEPLELGSYHVYQVEFDDGRSVACCVRTYDGWVPLGTYGYSTFDEYARNGLNGHNNFGRFTKGQLDTHATLLMRGVNIVGDAGPSDYMVGHAGLFANCLQDEPDCADYNVKEVPAGLRVGYHAMEMEARCRKCREADPIKPTFLTLDMTYKPANWFIYGPVADITNADCYPLAIGADITQVREVVETARRSAGPHPLMFTFESWFPEPDDPADLEKRRFPRPPTAEEVRLSVHYALGEGARGLYSYIHCTERMGKSTFHGAVDYPDLWREIGRCYRAVDAVAPLVSLAHPTHLATASDENAWVRTLVCGPEALLLVCANDNFTQERTAFRYQALEDVALTLPKAPWLRPEAAWLVTEDGFEPLAMEDGSVRLSRLEVAELVLVAADPALAERLWQRHRELERDRAEALLRQWRRQQDSAARKAHALRRLAGEFSEYAVVGTAIGAYGAQDDGYWNPADEGHWVFEFGKNEPEDAPDMGAEWKLIVDEADTGKPWAIYLACGSWGRPLKLTATAPDGAVTDLGEASGPVSGGRVIHVEFTPETVGEHTLRAIQSGSGPRGGRAAHAIYVIPAELEPPEVP